ncbi:MAG: hypothetical protein HYU52_02560 [Acidobacteria bacterium]|nr:hypothetical protein [Acidobacteriota bacterium]
MIPELIAVATLLATGIPVVYAFAPGARGSRVAGEAFLIGAGLATIILLLLSHVGIRWSAVALLVPLGVVALASLLFARRGTRTASVADAFQGSPAIATAIDAATAGVFILYVTFATLTNPWDWDFWAIWGLKAKTFFAARGIDWEFLGERWNEFAHGEYPPLLPLVFDVPALFRGAWSDRWTAIVSVAFSAAALLVVRRHVLDDTRDRRVAALATFAATGAALAGWVGLADVAFLAFATASVLSLRRSMRDGDSAASGAMLLGFAALTKNEGVALLAIVTLATLLTAKSDRLQRVLSLWPAFAIAATWQIPRIAYGLKSDLFLGEASSRFTVSRFVEAAQRVAAEPPHHPYFWVVVAVCVVFGARWLREEAFLASIVVLQFLSTLVVYAVTANDIAWQVSLSWRRVSDHPALLALVLAVVVLVRWSRSATRTS